MTVKRLIAALCLLTGIFSCASTGSFIEDLKNKNTTVRDQAIQELGRIGPGAVEPLIVALQDSDQNVRAGAAMALGLIKDSRAIEPLVSALKDKERQVRANTVQALVAMGSDAVGPLITALGDKERNFRLQIVKILGLIKDTRAIEPLSVVLMENTGDDVSGAAVQALGEFGIPAVETLISALRHPKASVKKSAAEQLGKIKDARAVQPLIAALKDVDSDLRASFSQALGAMGPAAIEPLLLVINDPNPSVQWGAAVALDLIGAAGVEPLIAVLKEGAQNARAGAAMTLGLIKDSRAVEPLIAALRDSDQDLRAKAVEALGRIEDKRAVEPLIISLKDADQRVRENAIKALYGFWPEKQLIAALSDSDHYLRAGAATVLGNIHAGNAIEPLAVLLYDPFEDVQVSAADALGQIGGERVFELFTTSLRHPNVRVRNIAVDRIGVYGGNSAIEPLVAALQDRDQGVRENAAYKLRNIGSAAQEPLIAALKNMNAYDRINSIEAIIHSWSLIGERIFTDVLNISKSDLEYIAGNYVLFFHRAGETEIRLILFWNLQLKGGERMINEYLNSNVPLLSEYARKYAFAKGYILMPVPGPR